MSHFNSTTYHSLLKTCTASKVTLVAVSKTKPIEAIQTAYELGQRHFGENRVQELVDKANALPKDIQWHQIGTLQRNKVKYIAPFVHLIHAVDSIKLLKEINKEGQKNARKINCLLQFHIANEETKFGFNHADLSQLKTTLVQEDFKFIEICGVMGMASLTENKNQVLEEFTELKKIFDELKSDSFSHSNCFDTISMGMSGDYPIAIEAGSTMIRVGSTLFGAR